MKPFDVSVPLNLIDVEAGVYDMNCLPLLVVDSNGPPARVVLRRS